MTTRVTHTPGPWNIAPDHMPGCYRVEADVDGQDEPICDEVRGEDNARLIAAAPEMLALLRECADDVEEAGYPARAENIRALLAKVNG